MLLLLLCLSANPRFESEPEPPRVTLVELNHCYNSDGGLIFDQVIFWDWDYRKHRWTCCGWAMLKDCRPCDPAAAKAWCVGVRGAPPYVAPYVHRDPAPLRIGGRYVSQQADPHASRVEAELYRETWSSYDPEVADRNVTPQEKRRRLW